MVDEYKTTRRYARSARYLPVLAGLLSVAAASVLSPRAAAQGGRQVNAGADVPGEILVGYRNDVDGTRASQYLGAVGHEVSYQPAIHTHRIKLANGVSADDAIAALRARNDVLYAVHNHYVRVAATPNDPYFSSEQWAPQKVQANLAWGIWNPRCEVILAIIDSGVDSTNPDLTNVMYRNSLGNVIGYNAMTGTTGPAMDVYGHGTHCAGIAAAQVDNGIGIAGIAGWNGQASATSTANVKIMPVQVVDNTGSGTDADVAAGIIWAVENGAKVISISLGEESVSVPMEIATNYAWTNGALVCAAAGNNGTNAPFYPAANPNVISVAATDNGDTIQGYSDYGSWVSIAAPGANIYSTVPTYAVPLFTTLNYGLCGGTSMAAPHVAGEAAVLFAQNPALTNQDVSMLITANVDPYNANGMPIASGAGRMNVFKALAAATTAFQEPQIQSLVISPNAVVGGASVTATITLSAPNLAAGAPVSLSTTSNSISLPGTVVVARGTTSATFNITTSRVYQSATIPITASCDGTAVTATIVLSPVPSDGASASFLKLDGTTQGNWKGVYGASGYDLVGDMSSIPSFANLAITGASTYTWSASDPNDVRALLKEESTTDRIAACWYSTTNFTFDTNLTDGQGHQIAFYAFDNENAGRVETISVIDANTGAVLNTQSLSSFAEPGYYLVWYVTGHVKFQINLAAGGNAVVSGLFFDPGAPSSNGPIASPIIASPNLPVMSAFAISPTSVVGGTSATGTVSLSSAPTSNVTVTLLAGSNVTVPSTVTIPAGSTFATFSVGTSVVSSTTASPVQATYAGLTMTSGITLTAPAAVVDLASASFVRLDTTTNGNWKGVYGSSGYMIEGDSSSLPSYAAITASGASTYTWNASDPTDIRALLKEESTTDRIAACWFSGSSFTFDVPITDGNAHQIAFYSFDYERAGRTERIDAIDPSTGNILCTQTLTSFATNGAYTVWKISGHVQFKVTLTGSNNAVVSGVFLDPASTATAPVTLTSLAFAPASVLAGSSTTGTVTLSAPATTATTVTLTTQSTAVSLPGSVIVPANQTSASFNVNTNSVTSASTAVITSTANSVSVSGNVTVTPVTTLSSLVISPSPVSSGGTATGTLTLSGPASVPTAVAISSSNSALSMPATVTIAAGQTSATFTVTAGSVTSATSVTVTGTFNGLSVATSVTVNPLASISSIVMAQASLTSGSTGTGTVTLSSVASSSTTVTLASNNSALSVPASVTIAAGQSSVSFTVTANTVTSATSVTVTGNLNSTSATASETVNPLVRLSSIVLAQASLTSGSSGTGTATLSSAATSTTTVTLASNNSALSVPASVTFAAGQSSVSFTVTANTVASAASVTVTGTLNSSSAIASETVNPLVRVNAITITPSTVTGGSSATGTITLNGPTTNAFVVTLTTTNSNVSVPATVTIPAGQSSATFAVATTTVSTASVVNVTASANSYSVACTLTLNAPVSNNITSLPASATFVRLDTTTNGNWKGVYGSSGYTIEANSSSLPSFVNVTVTGASTWTWNASDPTDVRAMLKAASTTDRIAACWYAASTFTFDVPVTDGNVHQIALYAFDSESAGRAERIDVINPSTGAIINTQTITSFATAGKYLVWNVTGHVQFKVTFTGGNNAVISGLFVD